MWESGGGHRPARLAGRPSYTRLNTILERRPASVEGFDARAHAVMGVIGETSRAALDVDDRQHRDRGDALFDQVDEPTDFDQGGGTHR